MALHHAAEGEVVDLATWNEDTASGGTKAIVKTDNLELIRLTLSPGKEMDTHQVTGPVIIHCLDGRIIVDAMGKSEELEPGQLLHLAPNEPHAIRARNESHALLTVMFIR